MTVAGLDVALRAAEDEPDDNFWQVNLLTVRKERQSQAHGEETRKPVP
jgi:hypothetical protein